MRAVTFKEAQLESARDFLSYQEWRLLPDNHNILNILAVARPGTRNKIKKFMEEECIYTHLSTRFPVVSATFKGKYYKHFTIDVFIDVDERLMLAANEVIVAKLISRDDLEGILKTKYPLESAIEYLGEKISLARRC